MWDCQAVEGGEEGEVGGQEVAMCQMAGTEGMRARRVRVRAKRPSLETPVVWVCSDDGGSLLGLVLTSCISKVERKGVVGVLVVVSSSERGR